jgi:uncharacterized protein YecE (DUF72 family)
MGVDHSLPIPCSPFPIPDFVIRVGPAGWSYPDSAGHIYPAGLAKSFDPLAFTASYFDTIEINASFYAPQPARNYASWVKRVAGKANFRFTAKLWRKFTHGGLTADGTRLTETWTADDVRKVVEGMQVLRDADRLGAVLAQFPWSFKPSAVSRQLLADLAEAFAPLPMVVELRHGGWAKRQHALLLKRLGLGFCNIDQPVIGDSLGPTAGVTSAIGYVRLHGRRYDTWFASPEDAAQRYDYLYTAEELAPWVERIRRVAGAEGVADVYVISNNHFEGKGPANALMIRALLEGRKVAAPPVLFDTYRRVLEPLAERGTL